MKKVFEMPEVSVEKFESEDILTLSLGENGNIPVVPW